MKSTAARLSSRRRTVLLGALLAFIYMAWAIPFMLESSVVAIDGQRYYGLFDDAMISMRYAWNFSHGHGLVWNPGERIEGYTNLLWTLIMSVYTGLLNKPAAVLAVQITGLAIVLGCCALVWKLARRVGAGLPDGHRLPFAAAAILMTLLYYPLSYWALTGMETGLLTLLLLAAMLALETYVQNRHTASLVGMAALLGLAYLTREDSALFALPMLLYALTLPGSEDQTRGPRHGVLWLALGVFLLFPIAREALRLLYYGDVLPNTYYLKLTGMPLAERLRNGLGFTSLYLITHAIFLGVGIVGAIRRPDRRKMLYMTLVVLPILYQIWVGGDPVRAWRMMAPAQPLAAMLFAQAVLEWLPRRADTAGPRRLRLLAYATAVAVLSVNLIFMPYIVFQQRWFPLDFYRLRINAAVAVNEVTTEEATVAVLAAGVIPYYTDRRAHDMLGKSDSYIASLPADISGSVAWNGMNSVPGHNKYDLQYSIKQLRPTYAETSQWGRQDITDWMKQHYVPANYRGVELWLLRGDPAVRWELLAP